MAGDPLDTLTPEEFAEFRGGLNQKSGLTPEQAVLRARAAASTSASASQFGTRSFDIPSPSSAPPASSVPVGDNIAPVATAEQAGAKTFGQRLLSGATSRARGLLKGTLALAPVVGAVQAATAPQSEVKGVADSLGLDYNGDFGRPIANAANFLVKTGDAATFGLASAAGDKLRRLTNGDPLFDPYTPPSQQTIPAEASSPAISQPQLVQPSQQIVPGINDVNTTLRGSITPTQSSGVTGLSGDNAKAASDFIDSSGVPASGTGFIRNNTTGAVTQLSTPARPAQPIQQEGGLQAYGHLAGNLGPVAFALSERNRSEKLQQRTAAINLENAKARAAFKPDIKLGLDGRPIVTDVSNPNAPKSVIVTPTQRPSLQQYKDAVRKDPRGANKTETQLENDYNHLVSNGQF